MSDIASFISGESPDKFGRHIDQILAYNHFWLEHDHKYIQVLFPIDEGTKFNRHAPVVDAHDREVFARDESLRNAHIKALDLMLEFWGMERNDRAITSSLALSPSNHIWLKVHDHNQLRLTRVIRSLYLLGNQELASNLSEFVIAAATEFGGVSDKTITYWKGAIEE